MAWAMRSTSATRASPAGRDAANAAHAAWNCGRPNAAKDLADLVESFGGSTIQDVIRVGREAPKKAAARATAAHNIEVEEPIFGPLARHLAEADRS